MNLNIAIGFVTGRKHFQHVLTTHVNNWLEHGLIKDKEIKLHLFVAYDLKYTKTEASDYKNLRPELVTKIDSINFYGKSAIEDEKIRLAEKGILSANELDLVFGDGYAKKRNAVVYFAIKHQMDRLIFLDDDEYPIAVMRNKYDHLIWMGQSVVGTHVKYSANADITHGHHCGYISPIPFIQFNDIINENDFRLFIEAISNEIISWDVVRRNIIDNKGVSYADSRIIDEELLKEVPQTSGMKFISGANLCFNFQNITALPPFYNPPGARGEDTFMSTALSNMKVMKVPVYTFHDGFLHYKQILRGNLPITLQPVMGETPVEVKRFINATIGWVRYKPLMLYITRRDEYEKLIREMREKLTMTIPKFCAYFQNDQFQQLLPELEFYHKNVQKHFTSFEKTGIIWARLMEYLATKGHATESQPEEAKPYI